VPARRHATFAGRPTTVRHTAVLLLLSGMVAATAAFPATAQSLPATRAPTASPYAAHIAEASQRFGIPTPWITAVMGAESAYDLLAVSPAGAMGLMQLMPSTWRELRVRYGLGDNPIDPRANILAGTAYLREMHERYGTIPAMLAAYNAGPARYDEHLATGRPLPAETRAYVASLAPRLGAGPLLAEPRTVPPTPPDWREAPLFVARSDDRRTTDPRASDASSNGARATASLQGTAPAGPQTEAIFLARSDGEDPR
jgi:hypothetical protein